MGRTSKSGKTGRTTRKTDSDMNNPNADVTNADLTNRDSDATYNSGVGSRSTSDVRDTSIRTDTARATYARDIAGRRTMVGVFDDRGDAERAIRDLKDAGFTSDQIGIAMRDRTEEGKLREDTGTRAAEGAVTGAVGGGILGGLAGLLIGIGALAIPGIGPVIAGGALATSFGTAAGTAVAGAGIGAAAGGIIGALVGMGVPEEEARYFETGFRSGGILVTVNAQGRAQDALDILERNGADTGASLYGSDTSANMGDMSSSRRNTSNTGY
jgi:hypothetical protein